MAGIEYGHARSGGLSRWGEREGGRGRERESGREGGGGRAQVSLESGNGDGELGGKSEEDLGCRIGWPVWSKLELRRGTGKG